MSVVGTKELERVMNPWFGLEDLDIFFAELDESTKAMAIFKINERITLLETRVNILSIDISEVTNDDGEVSHIIDIMFQEADSGIVNSVSTTM